MCLKEFSLPLNHVKTCSLRKNESDDDVKLNQILFHSRLTLEKIRREYMEGNGFFHFKSKYGISSSELYFLLDKIEMKRTHSESCMIGAAKTRETLRAAFGVENVSQIESIKEKKRESAIKKYGVDNVRKSKEVKDKILASKLSIYGKRSVPNRFRKMNEYWESIDRSSEQFLDRIKRQKENYKVWFENLSSEEKQERHRKRCGNPFKSKLEKRVLELLNEYDLSFSHQFWLKKRPYDFCFQLHNLILEINGDYWHANPNLYEKNHEFTRNGEILTAEAVWERDRLKKSLAEAEGYRVIYLWESEMEMMSDDDILLFVLTNM